MNSPAMTQTPTAVTPAQSPGFASPLPSTPLGSADIAAKASTTALPGISTQYVGSNAHIDGQGRVVIHIPINEKESRGMLRVGYEGKDNGESIRSGQTDSKPTNLNDTTAIDCKDRYSIKKVAENGSTHFEITLDNRVDLLSLTVDGRPVEISQAAVREQIERAKAAPVFTVPRPISGVAIGTPAEQLPAPTPMEPSTSVTAATDPKIAALEQHVGELSSQVKDLQQQLAALKQRVTDLGNNSVQGNDSPEALAPEAFEVPTPLMGQYPPQSAQPPSPVPPSPPRVDALAPAQETPAPAQPVPPHPSEAATNSPSAPDEEIIEAANQDASQEDSTVLEMQNEEPALEQKPAAPQIDEPGSPVQSPPVNSGAPVPNEERLQDEEFVAEYRKVLNQVNAPKSKYFFNENGFTRVFLTESDPLVELLERRIEELSNEGDKLKVGTDNKHPRQILIHQDGTMVAVGRTHIYRFSPDGMVQRTTKKSDA